jgi:hypothetical protein
MVVWVRLRNVVGTCVPLVTCGAEAFGLAKCGCCPRAPLRWRRATQFHVPSRVRTRKAICLALDSEARAASKNAAKTGCGARGKILPREAIWMRAGGAVPPKSAGGALRLRV